MAKTEKELEALKKDIEELSERVAELTDEELARVVGGWNPRTTGTDNDGPADNNKTGRMAMAASVSGKGPSRMIALLFGRLREL